MSLELETNLGRLIVELFPEQSPKTCLNFIKLAKIHFYDYCVFHRVEKDFIAQTGDPTATGKGGESIFGLLGGPRFFKDELVDPAKVTAGLNVGFKQAGILGMANMGRDKNASQFFVTLADSLGYLDDKYTPFGRVCGEDSLGVLAKINRVLCNEKGRPLEKVWIKSVTITEDPFDDPLGLVVPESVTPSEAFLQFLGVDAAEKLETVTEIPEDVKQERIKEETARAQALTLEIIGDLPSADVKPPENVLFVCKLNPMTEDEDLQQIFSRFGPIVSCQIIRDKETGNSLGYAFIEFQEVGSCEEAYLKMDKVLIDDRRIHVDFSQSVSKLHSQWIQQRRRQLGLREETDRNSHRYEDRPRIDDRPRHDDRRDYRDHERRDHRNHHRRDRSRSRERRDYRR